MATRLKYLSDLEWVASARSDDKARPVLTGLYATEKEIVATDGHMLFVAPRPELVPEGLWEFGPKTLYIVRRIDGTYPNYRQIVDDHPKAPTFRLTDVCYALALCEAGIAMQKRAGDYPPIGYVTWRVDEDDFCFFRPDYLRSALLGAVHESGLQCEVLVYHEKPLAPLHLEIEGGRTAIIMPVRRVAGPSDQDWSLIHLDDLLYPLQQPAVEETAGEKEAVEVG